MGWEKFDTTIRQPLKKFLADNKLTNQIDYIVPVYGIPALRAWVEQGHVVMAVKDRGPGIPEHEQSRIFERFYRSPRSATAAPGTGMGLAIARDIIEAHGGTLEVRSQAGEGSEFFFRIPAVSAGVRA